MRISIEVNETQWATLCKETKIWAERNPDNKKCGVPEYVVHILKISALTDMA